MMVTTGPQILAPAPRVSTQRRHTCETKWPEACRPPCAVRVAPSPARACAAGTLVEQLTEARLREAAFDARHDRLI
jgi:hypothetical protein